MNQVLGKGAYKVVYKAIDREEGYEVAWNTCAVHAHPQPRQLTWMDTDNKGRIHGAIPGN